jgi:6-phosphogluconolactonase (cycloisomerase 2 family)
LCADPLQIVKRTAAAGNPATGGIYSTLEITPNGKFLYAANGAPQFLGVDPGGKFLFVPLFITTSSPTSAVATYEIAATGALTLKSTLAVNDDTGVVGMAVAGTP